MDRRRADTVRALVFAAIVVAGLAALYVLVVIADWN
jgi:hypothetical protein